MPGSSYVFDHLDRKYTSRSFLIQSERDSNVGVHEQKDLVELYYIQQAIRNQNDFFVDSDKNDSVKDAPLFEAIEGCATRTINQSVAAYILRKKERCVHAENIRSSCNVSTAKHCCGMLRHVNKNTARTNSTTQLTVTTKCSSYRKVDVKYMLS